MSARTLAAVLLATFAWSGRALAWTSPEHEAQGIVSYQYVLALTDPEDRPRLEAYVAAGAASTVANGSAAPDHCHSFWYSTVPDITGVACHEGPQCDIRGGTPHDFWEMWGDRNLLRWQYTLNTNENHFGEHTGTHWAFWHELAMEAARRHRTTGSPMCERLAIGIESFALHYVEDRTASGHAWTQSASGFGEGMAGEAFKDRRRGCVHGQGPRDRIFLGCWQTGLGARGRAFGDEHWSATEADWQSDDGWAERPLPQFLATTRNAAARALGEVVQMMTCGAPAPTVYGDTYASNLEMCRVLLAECCYPSLGWAVCDRCEGAGGLDPDNRLLSDAELIEACPFDMVSREEPSATDTAEWIPLEPDERTSGTWIRLALPPGTERGTQVARTVWRAPRTEPVHPDAQAATAAAGSILDLAGCRDALAPGAPLRDDSCAEMPCDRRPIVYCRGSRAPDSCAADPCARWYHHTTLSGALCVCANVHGDGICAIDRGESFRDAPTDCGPSYCGDGACDVSATENLDTCPSDCAQTRCGDAVCHADETPTGCPADCGPPGNLPDDAFACDADGVARTPVAPVCGDGALTRGESCQICPADGTSGPSYLGADACTAARPAYGTAGFVSHACTTPACVPASSGGWCDGFCDPDEGCVPTRLAAPPPSCSTVTSASPERDRLRCGLFGCHQFPVTIVPVAAGANFRMGLADYAVPIIVRFSSPMGDQTIDAQVLQVDPGGGPLVPLTGGDGGDGGVFVRPIGTNGWHDGAAGTNTELHLAIPGNGPSMMSQWIFGMVRAAGGVADERFVLRIRRVTGGPALRRADGTPLGAGTFDVPFSASMGSGTSMCTPTTACPADRRWCCETSRCEVALGCTVIGAFEYGGCACCSGPSVFFPAACDVCYSWSLEDVFADACPRG